MEETVVGIEKYLGAEVIVFAWFFGTLLVVKLLSKFFQGGEMKKHLALVLALAIGLSGCATLKGARHVSVVGATTAHTVLGTTYQTMKVLRCENPAAPRDHCISRSKEKEILPLFKTALEYDVKLNEIILATPGGEPTSAEAMNLAVKIYGLVQLIMRDIPKFSQTEALHKRVEEGK